jgi:hypothetical protein
MRYLLILLSLLSAATPALSQTNRGLKKIAIQTDSGQKINLYDRSYALVIGVSQYRHWERLPNPVKDAHEVGGTLEAHGFEVTYVDDPDAAGLVKALNTFAYGPAGQNPDSRMVVFFAGHGHTEKTTSKMRGFILPSDAPKPQDD